MILSKSCIELDVLSEAILMFGEWLLSIDIEQIKVQVGNISVRNRHFDQIQRPLDNCLIVIHRSPWV